MRIINNFKLNNFCRYFLLMVFSMLLLTGCKSYDTVSHYAVDMQNLRNNNSYTYEVQIKQQLGEKSDTSSYKVFIRGNNWKYIDENNPLVKKVYMYVENHLYVILPEYRTYACLDNMMDKSLVNLMSDKSFVSKLMIPAYLFVYDWHLDLNNPKITKCKMWQFGGFNYKNGQVCRVVKYQDKLTSCISDKYGISVYGRINHSAAGKAEFNVKNISTNVSNSNFKLAKGYKMVNAEELLSPEFYRKNKKVTN